MTLALLALLLSDNGLYQAGSYVGPVRDINCAADAGILCTRTGGSGRANLACNSASTIEAGCVTPSPQSYAGNKTFTGNVITPIVDAGVAAIGSLDLRASSISNRNAGSTFLISSNTADATTSATVGALTLQCTGSITATDMCVDVQDTSNNHLFSVQAGGTVNFSGHTTTAGASVGSNGTSFSSTVGAAAGGNGATAGGAGGAYIVTGGLGGAAGTAAGNGGGITLIGGAGGTHNGAVVGGNGGQGIFHGGAAGAGGVGGDCGVIGGSGGAASASHASGRGGGLLLQGAVGGASAAGGAAAQGGDAILLGGIGGADTVNFGAGTGGALTLQSGNAGNAGSGSGASGGAVILDTGSATGAAAAATMAIGATNAGTVTIGRSTKTVAFPGILSSTSTLTVTGTVTVGTNGTSMSSSKSVSSAIDFPNIVTLTCSDQTLAGLTDCVTGDAVACAFPSALTANLSGTCFMSASATVTFRLCNGTAGDINPASLTFGARCFH